MVTGLVSHPARASKQRACRLALARGQAMIPVLLAQTDQTFTMVLYHADARSYLRTRAKHLFYQPPMRSEGVDLSFSQTIVPYQVDDCATAADRAQAAARQADRQGQAAIHPVSLSIWR